MTERVVDNEIRLIPYYRNDAASLPWYQDLDVCKEYQNRHIGRRCVTEMLKLAKETGMAAVRANIYSFNEQSQHMFLSADFQKIDHEWYEYRLRQAKQFSKK